MNPTASVLMTAYNREKYIAQSIESVLASTFADFELIIVDDCSQDRTLSIAETYVRRDTRIRLYRNEKNLGDYPNRNRAAALAQGQYLKYVDSDDVIYPHGLAVMVQSMERFPDAGLGLCRPAVKEGPHPIRISPMEAYREQFFGQGLLTNAPLSAIIRRDAFVAVGAYSGIRQVGDFELWLKLAARFPLVKMVQDLTWWRWHGAQEFSYDSAMQKMQMAFKVTMAALHGPDCPFNVPDRYKAIDQVRKNYFRGILYHAIKARKPVAALKLYLDSKISIIDLLRANPGRSRLSPYTFEK